jgi:hypothetical protein
MSSLSNRQTIFHYSGDDVYEITLGGPELVTLVRYRHNIDRNGEVVDYDELPLHVQQGIYAKVKSTLANNHREQE